MQDVLELARRAYQSACPPPFGILNPIHFRVIQQAKPLTPDPVVWFSFLVAPLVPMVLISYLLVGGPKDKRARESLQLRKALAAVGCAMLTYSVTTWRFTSEYSSSDRPLTLATRWAVYNNFIGMLYLVLCLRYWELGTLPNPVVDPWMALGRPRWVAAIDLTINIRHQYLGSLGFDTSAGPPNLALPELKAGEKPLIERHFRHVRKRARPTTRVGSAWRHLKRVIFVYCFADTFFGFLRHVGPDAFAPPGGRPWIAQYGHILTGLILENDAILFPSWLRLTIPPALINYLMRIVPPIMIWAMFSIVFHGAAFICVSSGFWEIETWDTDMFDAPAKATSLRSLWGRRWHQLFRRTFLICTKLTLKYTPIPKNTVTFFVLIYLFSGLLHAFGQLTSSPAPLFSEIVGFFMLAGLGCAIETVLQRTTGIKAQGFVGYLWTFTWTILTGELVTHAWVDGGWAACSFFPDKGFGELVIPYVLKYVLTLEPHGMADSAIAIVSTAATTIAETVEETAVASAAAIVESAVTTATESLSESFVQTVVTTAAEVVAEL